MAKKIYSFKDSRGALHVDCSECTRGETEMTKTNAAQGGHINEEEREAVSAEH